jgi:hypothetical protein
MNEMNILTHQRLAALGHGDGIVVPLWGKNTSKIGSFRTWRRDRRQDTFTIDNFRT